MMTFDKIWLTKKGIWRCNVYVGNDLYDELKDIYFPHLIQKLEKINYNGERIDFRGFKNL